MSTFTSVAGKSLRTIFRGGSSSSSISAPLLTGRATAFARRPFSSSVRNEMPLHITGRVEGLEHECITGRPPKWTVIETVYLSLTLLVFGYGGWDIWVSKTKDLEEGEEEDGEGEEEK